MCVCVCWCKMWKIVIFSDAFFLITAADFINVDSVGGGVIATISLQSFMPAKDLSTIDISLSGDGSRLCIVYGDGSVSVVDRTMYLRENPQRRSWAFQYSADDGRETPSSSMAEKPGRDFPQSPNPSRSPSVLSTADTAEDAEMENLSLAGLERQAIHRSASASSAKYLPDVVPIWHHDPTAPDSCPVRSPKSAFFRVDSSSSIAEEGMPVAYSPKMASSSPRVGDAFNYSTPLSVSAAPRSLHFGPSQYLFQSQTCPSFSPPFPAVDPGQEKAACCCFQLPYWKDKAQCRKVAWTKSRLFIWLSVHNTVGVDESIVILFSRSSEKVFSFRRVF